MGANGNTQLPGPQAIELAGPQDVRLFFSGPPTAITGKIPLVNAGAGKQRLEAIAVGSAGELKSAAGLPLREFPFHTKLHPGEQVNASGKIMLDPQTEPGSYNVELTVGGRTMPATVVVNEVVDLRIQPHSMTLLVGASSSYQREMTVENRGNVPLPLGARCEAPLFYAADPLAVALIGLHKSDKKSAESMVRGALLELSELQAGTLVIKRDPVILRPGQRQTVNAVFELPDDLRPLTHCHVDVQLYNAVLSVDIYSTAKAGAGRDNKSES